MNEEYLLKHIKTNNYTVYYDSKFYIKSISMLENVYELNYFTLGNILAFIQTEDIINCEDKLDKYILLI